MTFDFYDNFPILKSYTVKNREEPSFSSWIVSDHEHGQEITTFLVSQKIADSKKGAKRLVDSGSVYVQGVRIQRAGMRVVSSDRVEIRSFGSLSAAFEPKILFEDEFLFALSKPPSLLVSHDSILDCLNTILHPRSYKEIYLIHRLDAETTGILLIAKTEAMQKKLEELFRNRAIKKTYIALVHGHITASIGTITTGLVVEKRGQACASYVRVATKKDLHPLRAETSWEKICSSHNATLLRLFPQTGRMHQIRVHLASIGHPIIGEKKYFSPTIEMADFPRHLLHASRLEFLHPMTKKECIIYNKLPLDFCSYISRLFGHDADAILCEL